MSGAQESSKTSLEDIHEVLQFRAPSAEMAVQVGLCLVERGLQQDMWSSANAPQLVSAAFAGQGLTEQPRRALAETGSWSCSFANCEATFRRKADLNRHSSVVHEKTSNGGSFNGGI